MSWRRKLWTGNRLRLLLTLELAVMLPACALIFVNFYHLKSIQRDKVLEAAIHRDFTYMLAISEKKVNYYAYELTSEAEKGFPAHDAGEMEKAEKLDMLLADNPGLIHAFIYDPKKGIVLRSQPELMGEKWFRDEHTNYVHSFTGWFGIESMSLCEMMRKKDKPMMFYGSMSKRNGTPAYVTTAFFIPPNVPRDRAVIAGVTFDPDYMKGTFFPKVLNELVEKKLKAESANPLAITVFPSDDMGENPDKVIAASTGWRETKPEVTRKLDDVFRGLSLGIQFQDVTVAELGHRWVSRSFLILGVLSLLLICGLGLTYYAVSKEMALAKLKSDFVSNVSHELRTPLALIRLYAETLELGRVQTREKTEEYYRIIRGESERLTALINNILDFSRIEAGKKEYEFRQTDIADLVKRTLDSYRDQIQEQGFALEQQIEPDIPTVNVDREAIARSVVNLVNNALKYSAGEKFLGVRLYRANGSVKLEVIDRGIGIARSEQAKIFEKFYRVGDPLVHNTKGSGLGLSLVQHIAEAHGGHIIVESTPGQGSKFTLQLPIASAGTQAAVSGAAQA